MLLVYKHATTNNINNHASDRLEYTVTLHKASATRLQPTMHSAIDSCTSVLPSLTLVLLSLNSARRPLLTQLAM
jgi:hypothetical protein